MIQLDLVFMSCGVFISTVHCTRCHFNGSNLRPFVPRYIIKLLEAILRHENSAIMKCIWQNNFSIQYLSGCYYMDNYGLKTKHAVSNNTI